MKYLKVWMPATATADRCPPGEAEPVIETRGLRMRYGSTDVGFPNYFLTA
jgi:hypothetical protein